MQQNSEEALPQEPVLPPGQGVRRSFAGFRTVSALILREMSTRYGRSPGGYLWAILEPMGTIALLAFAFSLLFNAPPLGNNFILFYATGFLPFNLYQQVALMVARAIVFSRPLLFYPAVTWFDSMMARFILNTLTSLLVAYIIFALILSLADTQTVLEIDPILLGMALAALFGLGIGALNCALMGLFPTWDLVWSIATRPLFLASGVLFVFGDMPQKIQNVLWFNPLVHILGLVRKGFYPMYTADYVSVPFVLVTSLVPLVLGLLLLGRYHRDILENG